MSVEDLKKNSRHLRGTIEEELKQDTATFEKENQQLLKFHGTYQEDDRDQRQERRKQGLDRYYIFMVRSKIPGGVLTADQYLVHDKSSEEFGNCTLRITSRQGFQHHFVLKGNLKECIARINRVGLTTWGACGDVVRNVMATPWPFDSQAYRDVRQLARELKETFTAASHAYSEIWLDGEKLDLEHEPEEEPIYGDCYLPRKFKIGIAIPPRNDIDIYTNDLGLAAHVEQGEVLGYTVLVGGGFGMSHGRVETYPRLSDPLCYVDRKDVTEVCKAIVLTQRDYGNRDDRKQARLKYLIDKMGLDWFKDQVRSRLDPTIQLFDPKPLKWDTVSDYYGWNEQGDGRLFVCVWVPDGRIKDFENTKYKSAFREICETFRFPVRLTPNCNIVFHDIEPAQRERVDEILAKHHVAPAEELTEARRLGMACVALPTCGLALAESERVFQELLDRIDVHLRELGLEKEPILIRMTGCPNGCARPFNADISFVGKSPNKYVIFVGGSHRGDRMAHLDRKMVNLEEIPSVVRGYLEEFAGNRRDGETFSDYWNRAHPNGSAPQPEQYHFEPRKCGDGRASGEYVRR